MKLGRPRNYRRSSFYLRQKLREIVKTLRNIGRVLPTKEGQITALSAASDLELYLVRSRYEQPRRKHRIRQGLLPL